MTALAVTVPDTGHTPGPVTDGKHGGLLHALSVVEDPCDPRGIRYPLVGLFTLAVCAGTAGASSFTAIADWLHDLDQSNRDRLGFGDGVPAVTTMWRLMIRLAADHLSTVLAGWLHARVPQPRTRPSR